MKALRGWYLINEGLANFLLSLLQGARTPKQDLPERGFNRLGNRRHIPQTSHPAARVHRNIEQDMEQGGSHGEMGKEGGSHWQAERHHI